jgi:hypothetical protein
MNAQRHRLKRALVCLACLTFPAATASGQTFDLTPFAGYRFGGDFFELLTGRPVDLDGAPSFGIILDVPTRNGFAVEGLFTAQRANIVLPGLGPNLDAPEARLRMSVDHYMAGGLQELDAGKMRPFLTGILGLTRYAAPGDTEIRFTSAFGGGVKLLPSPRVGVRLSGQVFATFVDAGAGAFACTPSRGCLIGFHANVVWQFEFTAGLILGL